MENKFIINGFKEGFEFTRRQNVTLLPRVDIPVVSKSIYGFIGAYENNQPIPESLRLTMGYQLYLMQPYQPPEEYFDGTVIYAGIPNPGFGHVLLDAMARIWFAKYIPSIPIIWDARKLPKLVLDILDFLNIKNEHLFLEKPKYFKEVIFPFPGAAIGNYVTKRYVDFLGDYRPRRIFQPEKKIYISRRNMKNGVVIDEDKIEKLVEKYGFTVYCPELHSLDEQLENIATASVVLGVEGSALHSVLLINELPTTRFYALARHRKGKGVFEHIRLAKKLQYCTLNILNNDDRITASSNIKLNIDLLESILGMTNGLTENLDSLQKYITDSVSSQISYYEILDKFKLSLTNGECDLFRDILKLSELGDREGLSAISANFPRLLLVDSRKK